MSRSGYIDDLDNGSLNLWRANVDRTIRGKRGQKFLKELLETLDAMLEKRLIGNFVQTEQGEVCALGSVLAKRKIDTTPIKDIIEDDGYVTDKDWLTDWLSDWLNISGILVREIEYLNDEIAPSDPAERFQFIRKWAVSNLKNETSIDYRTVRC